jgi:general secretion pathway protein D
MSTPTYPRAALITRCMAVLAMTIPALAQSQPAQEPAPPAPQTAAATEAARVIPPPPSKHQAQLAEDAYLAGARLLDRNDLAAAEVQFAKALKLDPHRSEYAQAVALAHEHRVTDLIQQSGKARLLGHTSEADKLLAEARKLDPQSNIVTQHVDSSAPPHAFSAQFDPETEPWIKEGPAIAGPITLLPNSGPQSFHIHSDVQDVLNRVFSAYGIHPVFDESVKRQPIRFDLEDVPYQQASSILMQMAGLFVVPLDPKSVYIAKDSTENRQRFEHLLQETIYVPGMTNDQMGELGTIIRSVFDVQQASIENTGGSIVIRAPQATVNAINLTFADLIDGGNEVMLDLKLYSVDRTRQRNVGVQLPQQIGVYSVAGVADDLVNANQSLVTQAIAQGLIPTNANNVTIALALIASGLVQNTLLSSTVGFFGGGLTTTGVTASPNNVTLNLGLNSSDTRALDYIQLRVGDRQTGTFRVGMRYPITTSTYTSSSAGSSSALSGVTINGVSASTLFNQAATVTIPQIQYEDLGLTLKAVPTVQRSGRISMKLDLKIEALAGSAINNIPILASRQFASEITVADGESALLLSSVSRTESAALSGLPGLGELPGFQTATANKTTETDSSELVLLITPRIVHRRHNIVAGPRISLNLPQQSD